MIIFNFFQAPYKAGSNFSFKTIGMPFSHFIQTLLRIFFL